MSKGSLDRVLEVAVKRIAERFRVDLIILHGSYAKGTYIEDYSDVDLIVVSEDFKDIHPGIRISILAELLAGLEKPVEAIAYTKEELIREINQINPLILDALEYGKPILKTELYEEALEEFNKLKKKHGLEPMGKGWKWRELNK